MLCPCTINLHSKRKLAVHSLFPSPRHSSIAVVLNRHSRFAPKYCVDALFLYQNFICMRKMVFYDFFYSSASFFHCGTFEPTQSIRFFWDRIDCVDALILYNKSTSKRRQVVHSLFLSPRHSSIAVVLNRHSRFAPKYCVDALFLYQKFICMRKLVFYDFLLIRFILPLRYF